MSGWLGRLAPASSGGVLGGRGMLPPGLTRRLAVAEVLIVLALSLGRSAVYAVISFSVALGNQTPLAQQTTVLNSSLAPGRPVLDLLLQVLRIAFGLAPVALVWYLLARSGEGMRSLGLDRGQLRRDLGRGALLAAVVGGVGLAGYLVARASGVNLTVIPADLPDHWWRVPVLVAAALQNALLEEIVVLGFLTRRLHQLGWSPNVAIGASALLRGTYHLYQGVGGFVGNVAMGLLFGHLYRRWGRLGPMIVAHLLIDTVAFLGYLALAGHVDWLPKP